MSRTIFEVPQAKHPFAGLGTGIIIAENGKEDPKIIIRFPLYGIEVVTAVGEKAKNIMLGMSSDDVYDEDRIEYAKNSAGSILGITSFQMNTSIKKEEAVFARWLVFDYAKNSLSHSMAECGKIFSPKKDRNTVLNGIKKLEKENVKYLSKWQQDAYHSFWEKMNKYNYTLQEVS